MKKIILIPLFSFLFTVAVFGQCSNPNCGSDFAICGNTAELSVQNATTGYWTALLDGIPLLDEFTPNVT
jgi:hypothetical protein